MHYVTNFRAHSARRVQYTMVKNNRNNAIDCIWYVGTLGS